MGYSISSSEDLCYPGTTVLINKLGLKNQAALETAERVAVALRSVEIEHKENKSQFSFSFYTDLHRRLFSDIYDWAGELRRIDFAKKGTAFYPAADIKRIGEAKFQRLADMNEFRGLKRERLIDEITDFYHELNMLHPFREGNGRTQRLFFTILFHRLGYQVDFASCDIDALMSATIYAAQGVMTYLREFFAELLK